MTRLISIFQIKLVTILLPTPMINQLALTPTVITRKLTIILNMVTISQEITLMIKMLITTTVRTLMLLLIILRIMVLPQEPRELQKAETTAITTTMIILELATTIAKQRVMIIVTLLDMGLKGLQVPRQQTMIIVHMVQMPPLQPVKQPRELLPQIQQHMITVHMTQQLDMEPRELQAQKQQHTTTVRMVQMPPELPMILVIMTLLNMDKVIIMERLLTILNTELLQ